MPALSVSIDGALIATASTEGNDILSVHIGGTRIEEELARLDLTGTSHPEKGISGHLTWINSLALKPGQKIAVSFIASGESTVPGLTIDELFPDKEIASTRHMSGNTVPATDAFTDLRSRPEFRKKWSLALQSSSGLRFRGETGDHDHGFIFTVRWNSFHPERARLALHSYTLDDLEKGGPLNYFAEEKLQPGSSVIFEFRA